MLNFYYIFVIQKALIRTNTNSKGLFCSQKPGLKVRFKGFLYTYMSSNIDLRKSTKEGNPLPRFNVGGGLTRNPGGLEPLQ